MDIKKIFEKEKRNCDKIYPYYINTCLGYAVRILLVAPLVICALLACVVTAPLALYDRYRTF